MFKKKRKSSKSKFCPVCGTELSVEDGYCIKCGYSFHKRSKTAKKRSIKWRNVLIGIGIIILIYLGIRYSNGQPLMPESLWDLFGINPTNSTG